MQDVERDRVLSDIEERLRLDANRTAKRICDLRMPPPHTVVAVIDGGTGTRHSRMKFDLRIAERQVGLYVAAVERCVRAAMKLS